MDEEDCGAALLRAQLAVLHVIATTQSDMGVKSVHCNITRVLNWHTYFMDFIVTESGKFRGKFLERKEEKKKTQARF